MAGTHLAYSMTARGRPPKDAEGTPRQGLAAPHQDRIGGIPAGTPAWRLDTFEPPRCFSAPVSTRIRSCFRLAATMASAFPRRLHLDSHDTCLYNTNSPLIVYPQSA